MSPFEVLSEVVRFLGLPEDFHFLRPSWLWGLPVVAAIGIAMFFRRTATRWEELVATDILEALRVTGGKTQTFWKWLIPCGLLIACIAAAGPTWKKIPVPTATDQRALILLLDLSPSMLATDIAPDRLTRAKFKLIDILREREDGQTALVAYAGSPHRVAPLTDDVDTIEALLPALHPAVMPSRGSNTESAVELAIEMLQATGAATGDILLITDGVAPEAQKTINEMLSANYRLSILGLGGKEAVPIPEISGGFVSDSRGEIVLTQLNRNELKILADRHGGRYVDIQTNDSDVAYLLSDAALGVNPSEQNLDRVYDRWDDVGYYLIILLIPFAAYAFRRGLIFSWGIIPAGLLLFVAGVTPTPARALDWIDLWQTPDQQGARATETGDFADAAELFENPDWRAFAEYRNENYKAASQAAFADDSEGTAPTELSYYNRGNALALTGELEQAIASYEKALEIKPEMEDAKFNKELLEELLKQQEQQNQQNQDGESENSSEDNQESQENQEQQNQQQGDQENEDNEQSSEQDQPAEPEDNQEGQSEQNAEQSEQAESENEQQNQQQEPERSDESGDAEEESPAEPEPAESEQDSNEADEQTAPELSSLEATPEQLDPASEQFLRAIADDPGGLLQRKFKYESDEYRREQRFLRQTPNTEQEERF